MNGAFKQSKQKVVQDLEGYSLYKVRGGDTTPEMKYRQGNKMQKIKLADMSSEARILMTTAFLKDTSILSFDRGFRKQVQNIEGWHDCIVNLYDEEDEPKDVLQWYLLGDGWVSMPLMNMGEVVADLGEAVYWGRTETGQPLTQDSTIQQLAYDYTTASKIQDYVKGDSIRSRMYG